MWNFFITLLLILGSLPSRGAVTTLSELPIVDQLELSASVQASPPFITVTIHRPSGSANSTGYKVYRKAKAAKTWGNVYMTLSADTTGVAKTFTDSNVQVGTGYEYRVIRNGTGFPGDHYGFIYAGINLMPQDSKIDNHGAVLLLVEETQAQASGMAIKLSILMSNLRSDGWQVIRRDVSATESVKTIKAMIRSCWMANPNLESVFLLGRVPVPYAGSGGYDGHWEHDGAWSTDLYYADISSWDNRPYTWSDIHRNIVPDGVIRVPNTPGDGRFDDNVTPGAARLAVGRVDLSGLTHFRTSPSGVPETDFALETRLLKAYLDKNVSYRNGVTTYARRGYNHHALYDNVPLRDYTALFGPGVSVGPVNPGGENPWFDDPSSVDSLWGSISSFSDYEQFWGTGIWWGKGTYTYATGRVFDGQGGSYVGPAGLGVISPKAVFFHTWGSYFGDFDSVNNHLRAPLATSHVLCSLWGQMSYHFHHMALGETIGYAHRAGLANPVAYNMKEEVLNILIKPADSISRNLMGDPTLRLHVVKPPSNISVQSSGGGVTLSWTASPEPSLAGYYVYTAPHAEGPYTLIHAPNAFVTTTSCSAPTAGAYMVRAVKLETTGSGTYYNLSQGAPYNVGNQTAPSIINQPATSPMANGDTVAFSVVATANPAPTYQWRKNGVNLSDGVTGGGSTILGSTSPTLVIKNASASDLAAYTVYIANSVGSVTSASASLILNYAPAISDIGVSVRSDAQSIDIPLYSLSQDDQFPGPLQLQRIGDVNAYHDLYPNTPGILEVDTSVDPVVLHYTVNGFGLDTISYFVTDGHEVVQKQINVDVTTGPAQLSELGFTGASINSGAGKSRICVDGSWEFWASGATANSDKGWFENKTINGNFSVTARVNSLTGPSSSAIGVMIRESGAAGSRMASLGVQNSSPTTYLGLNRTALNAGTVATTFSSVTLPSAYVSLTRRGDVITLSSSPDGTTWTQLDSITLPGLSWSLQAGVFMRSHIPGLGRVADFRLASAEGIMSAAAGYDRSLFVMGDGTLWGVGNNDQGQLANGLLEKTAVATQIPGLEDITGAAVGYYDSVALKANGTVWTWGPSSQTPTQFGTSVSGFTDIISVAGLGYTFYALKADGTVYAWGDNSQWQLGVQTPASSSTPILIPNLNNVIAIAAGDTFGAALLSDGTVKTWGSNASKQLGANSDSPAKRDTPSLVVESPGVNLSGVTRIRCGMDFAVALKSNGSVVAWGSNSSYQLASTGSSQNHPVAISGIANVADISCGWEHVIALLASGDVRGWGNSTVSGALVVQGNQSAPIAIQNLPGNIRFIMAGAFHNTFVTASGAAYSVGADDSGQLGRGYFTQLYGYELVSSPGISQATRNVSPLVGGSVDHTPVAYTDGSVKTVGYNATGHLGDNTQTDRLTPVQVLGPSAVGFLQNAVATAGGYYHTLALKTDGTVWAWGDNTYGQLGNNNQGSIQKTPVQVVTSSGALNNVVAIAADAYHNIALKADGTVWTWGGNSDGQLGLGAVGTTYVATQIGSLSGVKAIAVGPAHAMALLASGQLKAWGRNTGYELGDTTATSRNAPVSVSSISGVKQISLGEYHSSALKSDGSVWVWGQNSFGQLALGYYGGAGLSSPGQVASFTLAATVLSHGFTQHCLKANGTVWNWGDNAFGAFGNGTTASTYTPSLNTQVSNLRQLAGGYAETFFISRGALKATGANFYGEIGDGTISTRNSPVMTKF